MNRTILKSILSPEQLDRIKEKRMNREHRRIRESMTESFAEIRTELTPAQQVKRDALQAEFEARFRKRGRRFYHPPEP